MVLAACPERSQLIQVRSHFTPPQNSLVLGFDCAGCDQPAVAPSPFHNRPLQFASSFKADRFRSFALRNGGPSGYDEGRPEAHTELLTDSRRNSPCPTRYQDDGTLVEGRLARTLFVEFGFVSLHYETPTGGVTNFHLGIGSGKLRENVRENVGAVARVQINTLHRNLGPFVGQALQKGRNGGRTGAKLLGMAVDPELPARARNRKQTTLLLSQVRPEGCGQHEQTLQFQALRGSRIAIQG